MAKRASPASAQLALGFPEPVLPWLAASAKAVEVVVPVVPPAPVSPAEVLALTGLRRMLPEGSVPMLYRTVTMARWGRVPLRSSLDQLAVVDMILWDGEPATVAVSAHVEALRCMTRTAMFDGTGEEIERMLTAPTTWWGMRWVRSEPGPFEWVERRRRWERCVDAA